MDASTRASIVSFAVAVSLRLPVASIEDFEAEIQALRQAAAPAPRGEPRELEPAP